MTGEVLAALRPKPGRRYVDGTVGGAGHAANILNASSPTGWLFGCDRDGAAVEVARARLASFAGRFEIRQGNFAELAEWVPVSSCDGVLLDLGVSSAAYPTRGGWRMRLLQNAGGKNLRLRGNWRGWWNRWRRGAGKRRTRRPG